MPRHAGLRIDLDAVRRNVDALAASANGAEVCAVVKANGYGHGAVPVARAALEAGADRLAVALVEEGQALREAGIDAPILLLSEPPVDAMADAFAARLTPTLYSIDGVRAAAAAAESGPWPVHLKVDTGMHRVGADPEDLPGLVDAVAASDVLEVEGVFTHLAVADEPGRPETREQLDRFETALAAMRDRGLDPGLRHAANSAGTIAHRDSHYDMVRIGIAMYGIAPSPELTGAATLEPALSLVAEVSHVKQVPAGDGLSYGLRHRFTDDATVAVVPLGYADGVARRLFETGGEVLIGGVRRPIRGVVTMDQFLVDVTDGPPVAVGDEVVLIGAQGAERITADEWAQRLGTIPYEVVCGFGQRLPRWYSGVTDASS